MWYFYTAGSGYSTLSTGALSCCVPDGTAAEGVRLYMRAGAVGGELCDALVWECRECCCAVLPYGAATEGVRLYMSAGAVGRGGLGSLLPGTSAVWLPDNQIGPVGASALGTAFAAGGLPLLTSLNLSGKCV